MGRVARIKEKIEKKLLPSKVVIEDETARHLGHREMLNEHTPSETHLNIYVVSDAFVGMSYLSRNRAVNDLIADEFQKGLHAVTIVCDTREEASAGRPVE